MYIVFIDESGQPGGYDKETKKLVEGSTKFFVLSGFMIDGNSLLEIEQKLNQVKIKYGFSRDIEAKWNSSYKALGLTLSEYKKYKQEVCEIIADYQNSVVGIVIDKESLVFIDSQYSSGVQLADFCAGAIFKKYEDNKKDFFDILKPAIRSHKGKMFGVGIKEF